MASSAIVKTASTAPLALPPTSPFAELLRRSRFASFDPAIRQTYSSPPANAHRGDWGLKRPISQRRKNAFITLPEFESHAHYIPWNNGESQVRFVRRIEEMNVLPKVVSGTAWHSISSRAAAQWSIDSEFAEGEDHTPTGDGRIDLVDPGKVTMELKGLGLRGPGQYGAASSGPLGEHRLLAPNLEAMSQREFARYLRKLRKLRPAFKAHIREKAERDTSLAGKRLYELAQDPVVSLHQRFIEVNTAEELSTPACRKIAQQPHPVAGLIYHHPSALNSYFDTRPQPGLVLQQGNTRTGMYAQGRSEDHYVTSFGGINARLPRRFGGTAKLLFDMRSEKGVDPSQIEGSVVEVRVNPRSLELERPPRVVGRNAQGLNGVRIRTEVTQDNNISKFGRTNPYRPGSNAYVSQDPRDVPQTKTSVGQDYAVREKMRLPPIMAKNNATQVMLATLGDMLGQKPLQHDGAPRTFEGAEKNAGVGPKTEAKKTERGSIPWSLPPGQDRGKPRR